MKVIYAKTIVEQLDEAITVATLDGRKIDRFELSDQEMKQLEHELAPYARFAATGCLFFTSYRGYAVQKV